MAHALERLASEIPLFIAAVTLTTAVIFQILPLYNDRYTKFVMGVLLALLVPFIVFRVGRQIALRSELWGRALGAFIVTALASLLLTTPFVPVDLYGSVIAVFVSVVFGGSVAILYATRL